MDIDFSTKQPPTNASWRTSARIWAIVVGVLFFLLYAATVAPSIVELYDDSLEFQLVGPTLGIAHPTGYPLYILLGGLWSRLLFPIGNWAWRMNLLSAVAAAITVGLLFLCTQRLAGLFCQVKSPNPLCLGAGVAAVLAFGFGPVWWSQATIAEVYALHNLFVAAILLTALKLSIPKVPNGAKHPQYEHPITQSPHSITLLCLLFGLGLTHHRTLVLVAPGVALMLWGQRNWLWQPKYWATWLLALLLPLLLYLWLPLRASMGVTDLHGSYVNSWPGFWDHVLARGYTSFFAQNELTVQRTLGDWWQLWQAQVGGVGLALGGIGLVGLLWRVRPVWPGLGIVVVLLTNLLFAVNYQVGDQQLFLLPAWLCFALLIGVGVQGSAGLFQRWRWGAHGVAVGCCLLLLVGVGSRGSLVNRSQDWAIHDYAVALAKVDFPPGSQVIALEGQATALNYMQAAEGLGRNATPVVADLPAAREAAVATLMADGAPTYLTQEIAGIAERYSFSGDGPLVRVWPRGQAQAGVPQHVLSQPFVAGALELVGYDLVWLAQAGGPALRLTLYWRPVTQLTTVYKLSLRLRQGDNILLQEDRYPLRLVAPTTSWLPGETVRDVHYLAVPATIIPQSTQLRVILYAERDGAEAGVVDLPTLP